MATLPMNMANTMSASPMLSVWPNKRIVLTIADATPFIKNKKKQFKN